MQFTKFTILILAVLLMVFSASTVFSADNDPVTVTSILKAAKCPLTKEQQKKIADILSSEITRETSFVNDLGADSLDQVELVMLFEDEFKLDIPDEDAEKIQTIGDAVKYIEERA